MQRFDDSFLYQAIFCHTSHRCPSYTRKLDSNASRFGALLYGISLKLERILCYHCIISISGSQPNLTSTYRHGFNVCPIGSKRWLAPVSALFSFTLRPPGAVVFRAPDFHGSGVTTLLNFFSHFSQTMIDTCIRSIELKQKPHQANRTLSGELSTQCC